MKTLSTSAAAPAAHRNLTGCWKLAAGRAVTLHPTTPGVLKIAQGRVWATLDGPHARLTGDLFLDTGAHLPLRAGQRVVIEPFGKSGHSDAAFDWVPAPATTRWPVTVAQPASDLRLALGSAGFALRSAAGALARLVAGLAGLVPQTIRKYTNTVANYDHLSRGLWYFIAHSRARRAQGAMNCGDSIASSGAL